MSEEQEIGRFSKHKFIILISGSIIVALILTVISMAIYTWSGTAQVDLSRPGLQSVQKEAISNEKYDGFSATGEVNSEVLKDFKEIYDHQTAKVKSVEVFGGTVLDDSTLKIEDPALMSASQ